MAVNLGMTMQFSNYANQRSWSETFYRVTDETGADLVALMRLVCQFRARALVLGNTIIDITYWDEANPSFRTIVEVLQPGVLVTAGAGADPSANQDLAPAACMLVLSTGAGKGRYYLQRGIADGDMVAGSFIPAAGNAIGYQSWRNAITALQLCIRNATFSARFPIVDVTDGLLTLTAAQPGWTVGSVLDLITRVSGNGPRVQERVVLRVASTTPALQIEWSRGFCTGGFARRVTYTYNPITVVTQRAVGRTRKTGGPRSRFRGRR